MERILAKETPMNIGQRVSVAGWVHTRRDHGKLIFIDLRDRTGLLQIVFSGIPGADELRDEWVVEIEGEVKQRPENMVNAEIETGGVELKAEKLKILNKAETPPFPLDSDGKDINEELRLAHRYIDLRRSRLQKNIRLRSRLIEEARKFLFANDFVEIETPYLTKTTPEGSRDFVVPSRLRPGNFFALPQSPQQYKQLLMASGFERYFQIARAFRDEDLRADRGFEHTQIDLEMSFVSQEDVMAMNESLMIAICEALGYTIKEKPFPRFTYREAMKVHGADKFDLRTEEEKQKNILSFAWVTDFPFFEEDEKGAWTFTHNPFSSPKEEHKEWLLKGEKIEDIITQQYDLVLNNHEVGGGSIRAHESDILSAVFRVMGYSDSRIEAEFGHMLKAFATGTPPHGGIAFGVERLVMVLTGEESIREVQAFPQTSSGSTAVMDAPSPLSDEQLKELGLEVKKKL